MTARMGVTHRSARDEWEAVFHLAMEGSAIGMCLVAPEGAFLTVNPALCTMLGRSSDELVACSWQELTHPDDLESDLALVGQVTEGVRDHYRLVKRYLRPDGTVVWGDLSVGVVREADRSVAFFVSQIVDITELVIARQALVESEQHYRLLAEHAADAVVRLDANGIITWSAPSTTQMFGWKPEEMIGRSIDEFVHADDVDLVRTARETLTAGRAEVSAARARCADGTYAWVSARAYQLEGGPQLSGSIVALRDVSDFVTMAHQRAELDARYRLLAENTTDVVVEASADGTVQWVSPSVEATTGWRPALLVGRRARDLVADADRAVADRCQTELLAGRSVAGVELRVRASDGETRWMSLHAEPILDDGRVVAGVLGLRDCQAEVVGRRALETQSVGHSILARAEREEDLLAQMCQATVDAGGYAFAWYARRRRDARQSVEAVATSREHADYLDEVAVTWADTTIGSGPTGRALRTATTCIFNDFSAVVAAIPAKDIAIAHGFHSALSVPVFVHGQFDGTFTVYAFERHAFDAHAVAVLEDLATQLGFGIAKLRDAQKLVSSLRSSRLLGRAIEQAAEAIVVTDPAGEIIYANPAAERSSGYPLAEMLGHNPRFFQAGVHPNEFFESIWSQLLSGETWRGVIVNRRKTGEVYEESANVAPVYDVDGSLVAYVAVKRDLTRERNLEAGLSQVRSDHQALVDIMAGVRTGRNLEETATSFCRGACGLDEIDGASVLLLQHDGNLRAIAIESNHPNPFVVGAVIPVPADATWLPILDRAGVWHINLQTPYVPMQPRTRDASQAAGITAAAVVPVHWNDALVGAVAVFTHAEDGSDLLAAREKVITELGSFAASLLGRHVAVRREREATRASLRSCIDEHRFRTVYQPVVHLPTETVCGYEALTRFDSGDDPESTFAQAYAVGLGPELEAACVRRALEGSTTLPAGPWLSVNLSPMAILDGRAAPLLRNAPRQVVVEVTERSAIHDYVEFRRALDAVPGVWTSIDDAGAAYGSLRHILELRPEIVKLDAALVRNIDTDPARQGLAAGLSHFAAQIETRLVGEGIETPEEAATLQRLGVLYGQGRLYGAPVPPPSAAA